MDNKRKVISYNDIKNIDDTTEKDHKHNLENTLDYYDDDMTRQVVGRLLDDYIKEDDKTYYSEETTDKNNSEEITEKEESFDDGFGDDFDDSSRYNYDDIKMYSPRRSRTKRKTETKQPKEDYEEKPSKKSKKTSEYTERYDYEKEVRSYLGGNPSANISFFKRTIIVLIVVFLFILSLLIYKMNKMNTDLTNAQTQLREFTAAGGKEAIENLKLQLSTLTEENKKLKEGNTSNNDNQSQNNENSQQTENSQSSNNETNAQTEYTVVKGDNAWKISQKVYGTKDLYYKILEANNLSDNSTLTIGQKLIIPPK